MARHLALRLRNRGNTGLPLGVPCGGLTVGSDSGMEVHLAIRRTLARWARLALIVSFSLVGVVGFCVLVCCLNLQRMASEARRALAAESPHFPPDPLGPTGYLDLPHLKTLADHVDSDVAATCDLIASGRRSVQACDEALVQSHRRFAGDLVSWYSGSHPRTRAAWSWLLGIPAWPDQPTWTWEPAAPRYKTVLHASRAVLVAMQDADQQKESDLHDRLVEIHMHYLNDVEAQFGSPLLMPGRVMQWAMEKLLFAHLVRDARQTPLPSHLSRWASHIEQHLQRRIPFGAIIHWERRFLRALVRGFASDTDPLRKMSTCESIIKSALMAPGFGSEADRRDIARLLVADIDRIIDAEAGFFFDRPRHIIALARSDWDALRELRGHDDQALAKLCFRQDVFSQLAIFLGVTIAPRSMTSKAIAYGVLLDQWPTWSRRFEAELEAIAMGRGTVLALRLAQQHASSGSYPEGLEALKDQVSPTTLIDPFSDKLLVYHRVSSGYTLYSVGADGRDDGGDLKRDLLIVAATGSNN